MSANENKWSAEETLGSAVLGLPYLDAPTRKGQKKIYHAEAMYLGHLQYFPKERHLTREQVAKRDGGGRYKAAFARAREYVAKHTTPAAAPAETLKPPEAKGGYRPRLKESASQADKREIAEGVTGGTRWNSYQWAVIAREEHRQIARGNKDHLPRIVDAIQREIFPVPLRRKLAGIVQQQVGGKLRRALDAGFEFGRENIPGFMHPGPLAAAALTRAGCLVPEETAPAAAAEPAPPVVPVLEMVSRTAPPPVVSSITPTPPAALRATFAHASAAFANTITGAVDKLLQAHAAALMGDIESRLASIAASVGASVARQVETGLRSTVMATLAQELGGPVAEPVPPADPDSPGKAPETPQEPLKQYGSTTDSRATEKIVLRADVLGFQGNTVTEIKNALNGRADLRFVVPEHVGTWQPRQGAEVFIATRFSGHNAERRCSAFNIRPHRVDGAGTRMILELEKVYNQLVREHAPEAVTH